MENVSQKARDSDCSKWRHIVILLSAGVVVLCGNDSASIPYLAFVLAVGLYPFPPFAVAVSLVVPLLPPPPSLLSASIPYLPLSPAI